MPIYNAMLATDFLTLTKLIDKAKQQKTRNREERIKRDQKKKAAERGQGSKERIEEICATTKTVDQPTSPNLPYPYRGRKKKKKGQYRGTPVNLVSYIIPTPIYSFSVVRVWQGP